MRSYDSLLLDNFLIYDPFGLSGHYTEYSIRKGFYFFESSTVQARDYHKLFSLNGACAFLYFM